jgi:hypothetical protein
MAARPPAPLWPPVTTIATAEQHVHRPHQRRLFSPAFSGSEYWSSSTWPRVAAAPSPCTTAPWRHTERIDGRGILAMWTTTGWLRLQRQRPHRCGMAGHTQGDCTADYMGTNQTTGTTPTAAPLLQQHQRSRCTTSPLANYTPHAAATAPGYRLFLESRVTSVSELHQYIDGFVYEGTPSRWLHTRAIPARD